VVDRMPVFHTVTKSGMLSCMLTLKRFGKPNLLQVQHILTVLRFGRSPNLDASRIDDVAK
ncbi:MAG: hypothetical protein AAFR36_09045, partial [Bacteroidota bacterium]